MKKEKSKSNFETLFFIKTHFTMIKCISIFIFFILTAVIIWLIISRTPGHGTKDYTSTVCWNFKFSLTNKTYLPSDLITLGGSCDSANDTKAFCPFWNITSAFADFRVLHNKTVEDGQGCNHSMQIQVVDFKTTRKRGHLLVELNYPRTEPIKEINIERSDDGKFCRQNRDCHFKDEFCSPSGSCTCPEQWVFIRNLQKCVPEIFKANEHCDFTEQCQVPKTTCQNGSCECSAYYTPDSTFTQCIPEAIFKIKGRCLFTTQCKISNSICQNGSCECIKHYTPDVDYAQCLPEAVYKVKGLCLHTSQCKFPNSVCHNSMCECVMYYTPNFDSTRCIPEGRDCGDNCLIDGNCQIQNKNSVCKRSRCDCYTERYDSKNDHSYNSWKDRYPKSSASSKAAFVWTILILVVFTI